MTGGKEPPGENADFFADLIGEVFPSPRIQSPVPEGFVTLHEIFLRLIEKISIGEPDLSHPRHFIERDKAIRRWALVRMGGSLFGGSLQSFVFSRDLDGKSRIPAPHWRLSLSDAKNKPLRQLVLNRIINEDHLIGSEFGIFEGKTAVVTAVAADRFVTRSLTNWAKPKPPGLSTPSKEAAARRSLCALAIESRDGSVSTPLGVVWRKECGLPKRSAERVWSAVAHDHPHLSSRSKPRRKRPT